MADNIIYSTISLNCNKKKRKTEEDTILSLTDDVNNVILSEDPLINAEFNVSQGYRVHDEYFAEVKNSKYTIIPDYEHSQGKLGFKKTSLVIDTNLQVCSCCNNDYCLHYQAFVQCSQIMCLKVCEANVFEEMMYYLISPTNISILVLDTLHNFTLRTIGGCSCNSCLGKCKQQTKLQNILAMTDQPSIKSQRKIEYNVVTSAPIPFILDEALSSSYDQQLREGIQLPKMLIPEQKYCKNGYEFNREDQLKLENTGIVIYTKNDVIRLNQNKVYSSICDGSCKCQAVYEGQNMLLLNVNNKYFIHYSLLCDYSELMTMSRNTPYGYLSAKNQKLQRMGRKGSFKYHVVHLAWNSYLRLVDLDYSSHYTCSQCKLEPKIVVIDGIAMGIMRSLPEVEEAVDYEQKYPMIDTSERVFIHDVDLRNALLEYSLQGLQEDRFDELLEKLNNKEFCAYIIFNSSNYIIGCQ
ncbi:hypothetical protein LOD99_10374 [Oopsacas minuta]|uniref:Uncharacterized protein n=1 Tax=Oopsacas minuta TaxID=111878 RepID=A0AAV7KHS5_9METZ|nr:hypothetical protein LOD99_10374 [Oopsacas minuta]